jgi:hypothetical protein
MRAADQAQQHAPAAQGRDGGGEEEEGDGLPRLPVRALHGP